MMTDVILREHAAQRLQRVFRGWRVRKHVVWTVRTQLDAFMNEMEADVEIERLLLGLDKPQTHSWLDDASSWSLRLPRIEDNVFGWKVSFPAPAPLTRVEGSSTTAEERGVEGCSCDRSDHVTGEAKAIESLPAPPHEDDAGALDSPPSPAPELPLDDNLADAVTDEKNDDDAGVVSHDEAEREVITDALDSDGLDAIEILAAESIVATHGADSPDELQSLKTQTTVDPITRVPHLSVDEILATYTKDEIKLELEWARQALRDRLQYLRSRSTC